MSNLTLNVKKKWFDMILLQLSEPNKAKSEEYRSIKKHWVKQFFNIKGKYSPEFFLEQLIVCGLSDEILKYLKQFETITFLNGMKKKTPKIVIECKGITIGKAVPEWSDNWQGEVFIIKLGKIISTENIN